MRMIWITPKYPLGTPDGARMATCSLVRQLAARHVPIDMVCLVPKGEEADPKHVRRELNVRSCTILHRSASRFWPLPRWGTPLTFRTFADPTLRRAFHYALIRLFDNSKPDVQDYMVFDGLHTVAALPRSLKELSKQCRLIYRAHNVEWVLWEQCAQRARTPWFRWFFRTQARWVRDFESQIAQDVDVIAPVSDEDGQRFEQIAADTPVSVTRIGMDFSQLGNIPWAGDRSRLELLFIGRLDWIPNRAGLEWFLERVWPRVIKQRPGTYLKIAGAGNGRWLRKFAHLANLQMKGRVESVEPLYHAAALCIAPLFQGSGTRVKILESARYQRGTLTTALGAEGSGLMPGVSYLGAETEEEWVNQLSSVTIDQCRAVGSEAFQHVRDRFDGSAIASNLIRALQPRVTL